MNQLQSVAVGELMASKTGSVDPSKFPGEAFDLYSIPAFDRGSPEITAGAEIGSSKQVVQSGDVLLSKIVPHIRRSWIVGKDDGRRLIASGEWIVFRSNRADPNYLRHVVIGDPFHKEFMRTVSGVGGSLLRARPAHVAKIKIPLPPLPEQRRIAAILDQADALRAKRREALAELDQLTQSIFIEMFGAPPFDAHDWPYVSLGDVTNTLTGFAFRSDDYVDESTDAVRLCRGANVLPGRIDWSDTVWWLTEKTSELESFQLATGDIVLAMDRPWISEGFKIAQISLEDCPSLLVQRVTRIRESKKAEANFIFHLLKQPSFTRHCKPTETTVPHISPKEIRSYRFRLPPSSMQTEFCRIVSTVDNLTAGSKMTLTEADSLFSSLQHRAFRGEL